MRRLFTTSVPFDAAARTGGPAGAHLSWSQIVPLEHNPVFLRRERGPLLPNLLEQRVLRICAEGGIPITLGGDHSLTWHAVLPLVSLYGRAMTIVHFDAHHDAYPGIQLNHYTVFGIIRRRLGVQTVGVGYRHDVSAPASPLLIEKIRTPVYISVDVDYFDPRLVPSVGHAVPCAADSVCDLASFEKSLAQIEGPVMGGDIVEWCGAPSDSTEHRFIANFYRMFSNRFAEP